MTIMNNQQLGTLYAGKEKYIRELDFYTPEFQRLLIETIEWKIPNLMQVVPATYHPSSVAEVGCFSGHLIGNLLINGSRSFKRYGYDVNPNAISVARLLYPETTFFCENIFSSDLCFDLLVLSDIIEHIENDDIFLKNCKAVSGKILLNLPLEKSLATINRKYGFDDPSGHLRSYSLKDAENLINRAGYKIVQKQIVCAANNLINRKQREVFQFTDRDTLTYKTKRIIKNFSNQIPGLSSLIYGSNLFAFLEPY